MKREIKFRGKRPNSGKWIYGYPIKVDVFCYILNEDYFTAPECSCEVIPETVGQFTGLQDKNGKDIFEGDIVASTCNKMKPKKDETDLFETPEFELKTFHNVIDWFNGVRISGWRIKGKGFQTQLKWSTVGNMNLKVIGNIYDNPELLK